MNKIFIKFSFVYFLPLAFIIIFSQLGCTKFTYQFIYDRADYFLYKRADNLFDINDSQEKSLRKYLKSVMKWHKKSELPEYIEYIDNLKKVSEKKITEKKLETFYSEFLEARDRLYYKLEPGILKLLATLSPEQIKYFEKEINEENEEEYEEEFSMSLPEQIEERLEDSLDRMEDFFGELNSQQEKSFKKFIEDHPNAARIWFDEKKENQKNFIQALKNKLPQKELKKRLRILSRVVEKPNRSPVSRKWLKDVKQFTFKLSQQLTLEQKKRFQKELTDLKVNIMSIAEN